MPRWLHTGCRAVPRSEMTSILMIDMGIIHEELANDTTQHIPTTSRDIRRLPPIRIPAQRLPPPVDTSTEPPPAVKFPPFKKRQYHDFSVAERVAAACAKQNRRFEDGTPESYSDDESQYKSYTSSTSSTPDSAFTPLPSEDEDKTHAVNIDTVIKLLNLSLEDNASHLVPAGQLLAKSNGKRKWKRPNKHQREVAKRRRLEANQATSTSDVPGGSASGIPEPVPGRGGRKKQARKERGKHEALCDSDESWHARHLLDKEDCTSAQQQYKNSHLHRPKYNVGAALRERSCNGHHIAVHDDQEHPPASTHSISDLIKLGFEPIDWKGDTYKRFLDKYSCCVAALIGRPPGAKDWDECCMRLHKLLLSLQPEIKASKDHRRGDFKELDVGVTMGGGKEKPGVRSQDKVNKAAVDAINSSEDAQRVAGHQSSALCLTCCKIYNKMVMTQVKLGQRYGRRCRRPFKGSVFPSYTANLGPRVACKRHRDSCNHPGFMCAITALGDFNPDLGGHLIIFDLKVIIRFPPGATILVLSASMDHGNIAIHQDDTGTRTSFTQYCPGGLVRTVDYNFKTWKTMTRKAQREFRKGEVDRFNDMLASFTVVDDA